MQELVEILQSMAHDIEDLKSWKAEQEARIKDEAEKAEASQKEFEKFIETRKEAERKRVSDAEKLKSMMM